MVPLYKFQLIIITTVELILMELLSVGEEIIMVKVAHQAEPLFKLQLDTFILVV